MPLFGAHLSVAGGFYKAAEAAREMKFETLQIFSKAPSQWAAKAITDDDAASFHKAVAAARLKHITVHDSYLINLAAPDDAAWRKSINAFVDEIERADQLRAEFLVTHPGAHMGRGEEAGVARVIDALNLVIEKTPKACVRILLETTAGMGTTLGHRFEHLAAMLRGVVQPDRFGICLDTCHVFAAGYPIHTEDGYDSVFAEFDRSIGLAHLNCFHLNDSVKPLGSRVDRHAGIGLGQIGDGAFRRLVNDPRFAQCPMILETPKEDDAGRAMDPVNVAKLRSFLEPAAPAGKRRRKSPPE